MLINIHTHHLRSPGNTLEIYQQYPSDIDLNISAFSIGIHPWYISLDHLELHLQIIEQTLRMNSCLAVGECGLDKFSNSSLTIQIEVFQRQLLLAQKHKKAVILHLVSHFDTAIALKKKLGITVPLIIHGFCKSKELAQSLISNGFYLSFGSALLKNEKLQNTFKTLDKRYLFLETDDKPNVQISEVYLKAQELVLGIDKQIQENFKNVFTQDV